MLWLILLVLIIVAIGVLIRATNSARSGNEAVDALAIQESIKRNHPDDWLARLGPHEFQRAYSMAQNKRQQHLSNGQYLWLFIGFAVGCIPLALMWESDSFLAMCAWVAVLCGIFAFGRQRVRASAPEVLDLMRQQQGIGG